MDLRTGLLNREFSNIVFLFFCFQPLHKSLDPANLEQLITPLTTLGHLAQLAPEQFAAPLKSLVANFIVKDLLMNDRVQIYIYSILQIHAENLGLLFVTSIIEAKFRLFCELSL